MLITGALLFADGPLRYFGNAAFRVKLLLIGAAVLFGLGALRLAHHYRHMTVAPLGMKITAAVSLTFFLGAAIAGRVIGVL
jgi:cytochrome b subunit of formate dehydrogenase